LWYAVEAPCVVRCTLRKITHSLHPVSSPWSRIEVRHYAEGPPYRLSHRFTKRFTTNHLRHARVIRIKQKIGQRKLLLLQTVSRSPLREESAPVFLRETSLSVVATKIAQFKAPVPELDLPPGHIGIDEHIAIGRQQ